MRTGFERALESLRLELVRRLPAVSDSKAPARGSDCHPNHTAYDRHVPGVIKSPSSVGLEALDMMKQENCFVVLDGSTAEPAEPAVLTDDDQQALSWQSEKEMMADLVTVLRRLLCSEQNLREIHDTQEKAWLTHSSSTGAWRTGRRRAQQPCACPHSDSKHMLKPDFWLGPAYASGGECACACCNVGSFAATIFADDGRPALKRELHHMVSLIDGKLKLTPSALGELLQHLQWLTAGLGPSAVAHGMLCAREEFYLVTAGASPVRIIQGRWTAAGTAAAVQNFMGAEQKWEQAVRSACSQLRLLPVRALGRGLHGLVVEAADEKDERWALKVRLDLGFPSLEQEYIALRDCVSRGIACLPNNVSPFLAVCGTGQAYAMQPVGLPCGTAPARVEAIATGSSLTAR